MKTVAEINQIKRDVHEALEFMNDGIVCNSGLIVTSEIDENDGTIAYVKLSKDDKLLVIAKHFLLINEYAYKVTHDLNRDEMDIVMEFVNQIK